MNEETREMTLHEYVNVLPDDHRAKLEYARLISNPVVMLRCSFCRQAKHEVERLVVNEGVNICGDCVSSCSELLSELEMKGKI
jgi:hypothetical protein